MLPSNGLTPFRGAQIMPLLPFNSTISPVANMHIPVLFMSLLVIASGCQSHVQHPEAKTLNPSHGEFREIEDLREIEDFRELLVASERIAKWKAKGVCALYPAMDPNTRIRDENPIAEIVVTNGMTISNVVALSYGKYGYDYPRGAQIRLFSKNKIAQTPFYLKFDELRSQPPKDPQDHQDPKDTIVAPGDILVIQLRR
jgi:hypothetical protein